MTASAQRAAPTGSGLVEGEFAFSREDFRRIAAMAHADAGIALTEAKATLVYSRLARRLRILGLTSFDVYCTLVSSPEGAEERKVMLAALTTNVTRFFREPHHFDHLRTDVLPRLLQRAKAGGRVRMWSSACSSGQEPYSIAMTLLSLMPDAGQYDIRILATDIDPNMVREAARGCYNENTVAGVSTDYRRRFTRTPVGDAEAIQVNDDVRALIAFQELNLIGEWPMRGKFDAIFCRNVAIYFDDDTQSRLWKRLTDHLAPEGALYIGHSERIAGPAADMLAPEGITTYRPMGGAQR